MKRARTRYLPITAGAVALAAMVTGLATTPAEAQLLLNEANAVGPGDGGQFLQTGGSTKPYEGYDYGAMPYSGNDNSVEDPDNPGNPFPSDLSPSGNVTELGNGWDLASPTGFGRIRENAGDWFELVVTEDFADLRGWRMEWENDDPDSGYVELSDDPAWNNVRAGTIITISEENSFDEVRDGYPSEDIDTRLKAPHDTGHDYDLNTDTSFDPIGVGTQDDPAEGMAADWHRHFWLPEDTTDQGNTDTQYFNAGSDTKVDNDNWRMRILDDNGNVVQDWVGETIDGWGETGLDDEQAGGVNNQEAIMLRADPTEDFTVADYEDVDWSTFGTANVFNLNTEDYPDGVQDLSDLRAWVADTITGDTDYDGDVDNSDLITAITNFTGADQNENLPWSKGSFDGDGDVDNSDLVAAITNFTGAGGGTTALTASTSESDESLSLTPTAADPDVADLIYNPEDGSLTIDTSESPTGEILSYILQSEGGFLEENHITFMGGSSDSLDTELSEVNPFNAASGEFNLGEVLDTGLSRAELESFFTRAGYTYELGSEEIAFDLVVIPEPASLALLGLGGMAVLLRRRRCTV